MPQSQQKIRVLIVDDEPLARRTLHLLLQNDPEVSLMAECANGFQAIQAIQKCAPDLLFLDVQMPEMNGFEVLQAVGVGGIPAIIFVTAYDQYALQAFEVHALDYLLKPFDDERFEKALERAKEQIRQRKVSQLSQQLIAFLEDYNAQPPRRQTLEPADEPRYLQRLAIKSAGRLYFLKVEEIDWIEAADQYVLLHVGSKSHLVRESMNRLETQLDPQRFFRIHRSSMVNLERVQELQLQACGESVVILRDGTRLKLSRSRREKFEAILTHLF